jgi:hypothetical protein
MPEYRNPPQEEAARLNAQASATFDQGTQARETADKYVRDTVLFATVLFVVALAQRFKTHAVRIGANLAAVGLLAFVLASVALLRGVHDGYAIRRRARARATASRREATSSFL